MERHFGTEQLKSNLAARTMRGGAVLIVAQGVKFSISIVSTMILARLLTPEDYGLIGMVVVLTGFIALFKNLGLSTAMIQKEDLTHEQVSTLFWLNLLISFALAAITVGLAPVIAWFYGEPRLMGIAAAFGAGFIISGLGSNHEALIKRNMRFLGLAVLEITSLILGIVVAIVLSRKGAGPWALVLNQLTYLTIYSLGLWILCGWRPGGPKRYTGVRPLLAFGRDLTGYNVLNYFTRNLDNLLVGKFWGAQQLGIYAKAYQLLLLPIDQLGVPLDGIALTALSRLIDAPERYRKAFLRMIDKVAMFSMPGVAFMVITADWLVRIVLGAKWMEAAPIFAVLGFIGIFEPVANTMGWLMISQGRSRDVLVWGIVNSSITVISFLIGLPWGGFGVALSFSLIGATFRIPLLFWFSTRVGPVRARDIYGSIFLPFVAAVSVVTSVYLFRRVANVSPQVGVGGAAAIALGATVVVFLITDSGRKKMIDLYMVLRQVLNRKAESQTV